MTSRVQITFRRILPSDTAREIVTQKFSKLCSQLPTNARCHVVLERPHAGRPGGPVISARIDIHGAGLQICTEARNLDMCTAIREAFDHACTRAQRTRPPRIARTQTQTPTRVSPRASSRSRRANDASSIAPTAP